MKSYLILLFFIPVLQAASFVPETDEVVVFTLTPEITAFAEQHERNNARISWQQVAEIQDAAQLLFNDHLMDEAHWWITKNNNESFEWLYLKARHQQHQHAFSAMKDTLVQLFELQPDHVAAHLMAANTARIQADQNLALYHCQKTAGHTDLLTTQLCLLDTQTNEDNAKSNAQQLAQLLSQQVFTEVQQKWAHQMLAEWHLYTGNAEQALVWLDKNGPSNNIQHTDMWLQIQLALGHNESIIQRFQPHTPKALAFPDGLLIKLAAAEKRTQSPSTNKPWQVALDQRMTIRKQRQDQPDSRAMTEYNLLITGDLVQAKRWGEKNLESSQEWYDIVLMERAHE